MSRMQSIRNLAKSGAASAAIGGAVGGAGAYYTGQDIVGGASYGAMMGAGGRMAAPGIARAAGSSRLGVRGLMGKYSSGLLSNANKFGAKTGIQTMAGTHGALGGMYKSLKRVGPVRAGIAGGAMGLGYSALNSNQGLNVTHRNATLNQKLQYDKARALQNSAIRINETRLKKQIWQPGAY